MLTRKRHCASFFAALAGIFIFSVSTASAHSANSGPETWYAPPPPACSVSVAFSGDTMLCSGGTVSYVTKKETNVTYEWRVKGGSILSGQGSDSIVVSWKYSGLGSVFLKKTNTSASCADSMMKKIVVGPSNASLSDKNAYAVLGSAKLSSGEVTVTSNTSDQNGAAWNLNSVSLYNSFDFTFNVNQCGSADGMIFVMQNSGTDAIGGSTAQGSNMAYYDAASGVMDQSLGVELDIYKSNVTTWYDSSGSHLSLVKNKNASPLLAQVDINPTMADCNNHKFRVVWNSTVKQLSIYFDGSKKITYNNDIVSSIFKGNPYVYFGFMGATGGLTATQKFSNDTLIYGKPGISAKGAITFCEGDSTILVSSPGRKYYWSTGDTTRNITVSKAGDYTVTIEDSTGCTRQSDALKVKVYPIPVFQLGNDTTICKGEKAKIGLPSNNAYVYTWTSNPAGYTGVVSSDSVSPAQTTTYYLRVRDKIGGCSVVDSMTIFVRPTPKAIFSVTGSCAGDGITINNASTSATTNGTLSYFWNFGDSTTATGKAPAKSYKAGGTYTVWLVVTDDSTGCQDSISRSVVIYPKPKMSFTATSVCAGSNVSFTNTSTIESGAIQIYFWKFGDGTTSSNFSTLKNYSKGGTYTVWLIGTSNRGCKDSVSQQVTVYPKPVVKFGYTSGCNAGPVSFYDSSTIDKGYTMDKYEWDFGDGQTSIYRQPDHQFTKGGTYKVILKVTSNKGCTDTFSAMVPVYSLPKAKMTATNVCAGEPTVFKDQSTVDAPGAITGWHWDFGDGQNSADQDPEHTYATEGTYKVWLKVNTKQGCDDSTQYTVKVYHMPSAKFDFKIFGSKVSFAAHDTIGKKYDWDFGDGGTSPLIKPDHSYTKDGDHIVKLTISTNDGCSDSYTDTVHTNTSIGNDLSGPLNVNLYPNPFSTSFRLEYALERRSAVHISIVDINGRVVGMLVDDQQSPGSYQYNIESANYHLSAGVYELRMVVDNAVINRKMIRLQ